MPFPDDLILLFLTFTTTDSLFSSSLSLCSSSEKSMPWRTAGMSTQSHTGISLRPSSPPNLNCAYAWLVASTLTLERVFQNHGPTSVFLGAEFKFETSR